MEMLTPGELRVLQARALTGSNREAADRLGTDRQTVKNQLHTAYSALGVSDIVSALRVLGWLTIPEEAQ
jgi:DNA-binding NarL/FixJ family response regulator